MPVIIAPCHSIVARPPAARRIRRDLQEVHDRRLGVDRFRLGISIDSQVRPVDSRPFALIHSSIALYASFMRWYGPR